MVFANVAAASAASGFDLPVATQDEVDYTCGIIHLLHYVDIANNRRLVPNSIALLMCLFGSAYSLKSVF